jgi:thioredoxin 1
MAEVADLTDASFKSDVLESSVPVLVEFGADWCQPCRQLDPIINELAREWADRVKVAKLDVDHNVDSTMQFGVMSVPTLILFVNGDARERLTGFVSKKRILEKLGPHLPRD